MGQPCGSFKRNPSGTGDSVGGRCLSDKSNGVIQVAFSYDAMGRMLYTSGVAGTATTFEWDGWDMIREVTPAGTYRYYAPQGEILTFDFTTSGGSPVTSTYNVIADALGMHYMRQRWYDPTLGRFLSQDPIGFAGGLNQYGYVGGNPTNYVDPMGLDFYLYRPGSFIATGSGAAGIPGMWVHYSNLAETDVAIQNAPVGAIIIR